MSAPVDEFARIARLFAPMAGPEGLGLLDDAALVDLPAGASLIVTQDAIVAGVHFVGDEPAERIAAKALRVNLSDLAAKGADPLGWLLTLALPKGADEALAEGLARGFAAESRRFAIPLFGGDTVATPGPLSLSVTALGTVPRGQAILRSGARPGDRVVVSGAIGDGLLGLRVAQGGLGDLGAAHRAALLARYQLPEPRLAFGRALRGIATAALDVSDGLVADLGHLARASGVGLEIDAAEAPLSDAARASGAALADLLTGGDDYELALTVSEGAAGTVLEIAAGLGLPARVIGRACAPTPALPAGAVRVLGPDGAPMRFARTGWRHE